MEAAVEAGKKTRQTKRGNMQGMGCLVMLASLVLMLLSPLLGTIALIVGFVILILGLVM